MNLDNDDYEVSGFVLENILLAYEMGNEHLRHGINSCRHLTRDSPPSSTEVENGGAIPPFLHASYWCGA
jgi:hypothetical protein